MTTRDTFTAAKILSRIDLKGIWLKGQVSATKFVILISQSFPDYGNNSCFFLEKGD